MGSKKPPPSIPLLLLILTKGLRDGAVLSCFPVKSSPGPTKTHLVAKGLAAAPLKQDLFDATGTGHAKAL